MQLGSFAEALKSNTTLLTLNLGAYISNPGASQTAGSIQSTLMLNARLAGMEALHNKQPGYNDGGTTASVLNAMSDAVAAANGRSTPKVRIASAAWSKIEEAPKSRAPNTAVAFSLQPPDTGAPLPPPPITPALNPFASPPIGVGEKKTPFDGTGIGAGENGVGGGEGGGGGAWGGREGVTDGNDKTFVSVQNGFRSTANKVLAAQVRVHER